MDARGLDLHPRALAQFVALADRGSVAAAAAQLGTTPRSLTRVVRDLEREIGEPLLERDDRRIGLTPAGRTLHASAREVLQAVERFRRLARSDRAVLHVAHVANADTLAVILDAVAASLPSGTVEIHEHAVADRLQIAAVQQHRLDLAVCCDGDRLPAGLAGEVVRHDPLVLAGGGAASGEVAAPRFGEAWPAHDAAVAIWGRRSGRRVRWVTVPAGSGHELKTLRRSARAGSFVAAASTLPPDDGPQEPAGAHLVWRLVWRTGDASPGLAAVLDAARGVAQRSGWSTVA